MAFMHDYQRFELFDHGSQRFLASDNSATTCIDPELELLNICTNGWAQNKQPMQRFLSEHDQGPMLFQATPVQEPFGISPFPGSYRRLSPPRTTISSTDSCASPPCTTDFLQPHSPAMTDCVSPPMCYPEHISGGGQSGYTDLSDSCIGSFDLTYHRDDPARFLNPAETTLDCTLSPEVLPTNSLWPSPFDKSLKIDFDNKQINEHVSINSSTKNTNRKPLVADEFLVVNTQPVPHDDQNRPRRHKTSANYQADARDTQTRKRKGNPQVSPPKRQRTRPLAAEPSSPLNMNASNAGSAYSCYDCEKPCFFKDEQCLVKHRKTQHTRPFNCVYHFAGCQSTFASKNEWKRHVISQHLVLHYWICTEGACAQVPISSSSSTNAEVVLGHASHFSTAAGAGGTDTYGTVFNRKDLYTQHLRRMHVPTEFKKTTKQKNGHMGEWDRQVKEHQKRAQRTRCALPDHMECPLAACTSSFHGANAWDERMEHVARHLDVTGVGSDNQRAGSGWVGDSGIAFGGPDDRTLLDWSMRSDVDVIRWNTQTMQWELNKPLQTSAGPRKPSTSGRARRGSGSGARHRAELDDSPHVSGPPVDDEDDEDAEGEYDDAYV